MTGRETHMDSTQIIKSKADQLIGEVEKIIVGKRKALELILASVLCSGHILLEDLPGSGKTTLVKVLSKALGCNQKRIQFTPDLLPSDVVGTTIYNQKEGQFVTSLGPVNTNILLADEINRAIPRTQAALLEAMEERQVTIDGVSYPLPQPFLVMATQNPIEKDSTFPLPAAQLDRFFIKLSLGYPTKEEESQILDNVGDRIHFELVQTVSSPQELLQLKSSLKDVRLDKCIQDYIVELVQATRTHSSLKTGASPRASIYLLQGAKALAAIRGRDYVIPEDVKDLVVPVLGHRIQLSGDARYRGEKVEDILSSIFESVEVPPKKENLF